MTASGLQAGMFELQPAVPPGYCKQGAEHVCWPNMHSSPIPVTASSFSWPCIASLQQYLLYMGHLPHAWDTASPHAVLGVPCRIAS